jgi:O-antigen/teichoic acid export membrane protein
LSKIRIIGKNIRFTILSRLLALIITFFLFPFIVRHTGQELYGVYLIVMTVTGYFGLLDLGVMSALTKYVSEYDGIGDVGAINRIINASFSFYVLIGLIAAIFLFGCSMYFDRFFRIEAQNVVLARQLFTIAAISSLLTWPLSTFRGTVQGLNLWDVEATVNMAVQILNAFFAVIIFTTGHGIVLYIIVSQILNILGCLALYLVSKKKTSFKISFPYLDVKTFMFIFNFSFFMFLSSLVTIFLYQIHNFIIGYFISLSAVTIFAVAYNLQNYFRTINSAIGAPPWTVASAMEGRGDYNGQRLLIFKGTKYMSAVFLPVVLITFFFAEPFINYWMGPGFQGSVLPARIIIFYWLFNGTIESATGMLSAKGIVRKPLYITMLVTISSVVIGLTLIKIIGITAIALGLTLSMIIIGAPLYLRLSLQSLNISFMEYFNKAVKSNILLYFFVAVLSFVLLRYCYPKSIYFTLFEMALIYIISLALYYAIMLNKDEKTEIRRLAGIEELYAAGGNWRAW